MIHKEGIKVILVISAVLAVINICVFILFPASHSILKTAVLSVSLIIICFNCIFFRKPNRHFIPDNKTILSPADGTVMAVELTTENEFFNEKKVQVSIFMSVWNVHINWYPVSGKIIYYKYHPGKYIVARYPKSSLLNERNTLVIDNPDTGQILVRQIAGAVARRIVSYVHDEKIVSQGEELGFIRFGSRVDLFLPPGMNILVKPGDSVRGLLSPVAKFNPC
jgi:phosphatidylserine decarboxylase